MRNVPPGTSRISACCWCRADEAFASAKLMRISIVPGWGSSPSGSVVGKCAVGRFQSRSLQYAPDADQTLCRARSRRVVMRYMPGTRTFVRRTRSLHPMQRGSKHHCPPRIEKGLLRVISPVTCIPTQPLRRRCDNSSASAGTKTVRCRQTNASSVPYLGSRNICAALAAMAQTIPAEVTAGRRIVGAVTLRASGLRGRRSDDDLRRIGPCRTPRVAFEEACGADRC